ncbi:MAG: replicative DNA helicase [Elusimicrobia bacterium]|nr:replicative DNA helicase [Elusimicrobiota bacterium]
MNPADVSERPLPPESSRPARKWRVLEGQGRPLPHSLEAEAYLLSALLLDPADVLARAEIIQLTPEAFYDPRHGLIFDVARDMWRKKLPVAVHTVAEELKTRGQLEHLGGYAFLAQASERVPTTAQAGFFLEKVFEQGLLRALIREAAATSEEAYGYTGGLDELLGRHASKFQRLADFALRRNRKPQREVAAEARAYAQAAMHGRLDKARAIPFGGLPHTTAAFLSFDVREEDWLCILAGVPNGGKSTLLRQHVAHNLVAGKTFVVFLLETSRRRWLMALAAMFAGVNLRELEETRTLFPAKAQCFDEWLAWVESIMETQLWIYDDQFYLEDIERQIRDINRRVRERQLAAGCSLEQAYGLDGVLGDHLHLVQTRKEFRGNREAQVSYIGRTLKLLHKGLDVPGFWAAQLNRSSRVEKRRPRVSELRDSGTLEQDADAVHLIHTPEESKAGAKQDGTLATHEVELIQGKRRNGPADLAVDLLFHRKLGSYEELVRPDAVRPGHTKPKSGYKRGEAGR